MWVLWNPSGVWVGEVPVAQAQAQLREVFIRGNSGNSWFLFGKATGFTAEVLSTLSFTEGSIRGNSRNSWFFRYLPKYSYEASPSAQTVSERTRHHIYRSRRSSPVLLKRSGPPGHWQCGSSCRTAPAGNPWPASRAHSCLSDHEKAIPQCLHLPAGKAPEPRNKSQVAKYLLKVVK